MSEASKHWDTPTLDEIGLPRTPNVDPSNYPKEIFELYSVPSFSLNKPEVVPGSAIGSTKQLVEPGDVLLCKIVPHLVRVWCVPSRGTHRQIASGEWIVVRPDPAKADKHFLRYALIEPGFRSQFMGTVSGVGGSLMRARPKAVAQITVPLPTNVQQHRIVAKLDSLFKCSMSAQEELARIPRLVERYKQAIFEAAFRGLLTAEWRLDHAGETDIPTEQAIQNALARLSAKMGVKPWKPREYEDYPALEIPECWRRARVGDVALHRSGVAYKSERFGASGTQVVRLGNLYQGRLDLERSPVFIAEPTQEEGAFVAKSGDILVSQTGTRYKRDYGHCVLLNSSDQELLVNQRILCLSPTESVLPKFLAYYENTPSFRNFFFSQETGGVNQGNVGVGGVMDAPCPLPSLAEQGEIVHRVDAAVGAINQIFADVSRARTLVERLDQAALAKAFQGELLSCDKNIVPHDEDQRGHDKQHSRRRA